MEEGRDSKPSGRDSKCKGVHHIHLDEHKNKNKKGGRGGKDLPSMRECQRSEMARRRASQIWEKRRANNSSAVYAGTNNSSAAPVGPDALATADDDLPRPHRRPIARPTADDDTPRPHRRRLITRRLLSRNEGRAFDLIDAQGQIQVAEYMRMREEEKLAAEGD